MIDSSTANSLFDAKVVDPHGDKVGTVKQVYLDNSSGQPLFASVSTGLFGSAESFVPLQDASFSGDELRVDYDKAKIKDAPRIDADGDLSEQEQDRIFDYYGLGGGGTDDGTAGESGSGGPTSADAIDRDRGSDASNGNGNGTGSGVVTGAGHDTSGPDTDDAMTRSEERLTVGTQTVQTGRARLRKHIVTEQQQATVPVQHEEVTLEREPITDANVGAATDGPALSEEEHAVTLSEEQVVADKETVPVERVKLGTETHAEQQQVTEDVSHEEIELDQDGDTRR
jgi:uncharacterized protein (TIGR02271 family)